MAHLIFGSEPTFTYNEADVKYRNAPPPRLVEQIKVEKKRKEAVEALSEHMREISGDHSGSKPRPYLSPADFATLNKFRVLADDIDWAGSEVIDLRIHRLSPNLEWPVLNAKVWNGSPWQPVKNGLMKAITSRRTGEQHRAYIFGELGVAQKQLVAFADDGLLYSERGPELQVSYGDGWGCLPEPEMLEPALAAGNLYGVDAGSFKKPLQDRLIACIPKSALVSPEGAVIADPRNYGLAK